MTQQHNPPAFPTVEAKGANHGEPGMTLRDYFAAKAMQGLMGRVWADPITGLQPDNLIGVWAKSAYEVADAMMEDRNK